MHDRHALPGGDVTAGGVRLFVADYGPAGSALPVLLLHGVPTTSYLWHDAARDLAGLPTRGRRCLVPDLVGLGDSEAPADRGAYPLARQAATMLALLDELGVERCAVVGHDIGGTIAVHLAALAPERVAALGLLSPLLHADLWPVPSALPFLLPGVGEAAVRALPRVGAPLLRQTLGHGMSDEECAHYLAPLATPAGRAGLLRVFRAIDAEAAEVALRIVAASPPPTLVLWGTDDAIHDLAYGRRVAAAIPGSSWVPVDGAGHLLPTERPERVAEELDAFLDGGPTTG